MTKNQKQPSQSVQKSFSKILNKIQLYSFSVVLSLVKIDVSLLDIRLQQDSGLRKRFLKATLDGCFSAHLAIINITNDPEIQ